MDSLAVSFLCHWDPHITSESGALGTASRAHTQLHALFWVLPAVSLSGCSASLDTLFAADHPCPVRFSYLLGSGGSSSPATPRSCSW